jgi:hypothetical protein
MPLQLFADFCAKIEPDRRNSTVEKIICNNRHRADDCLSLNICAGIRCRQNRRCLADARMSVAYVINDSCTL